jgi:flagellar biosynthesis/type III secretory pathway protein FliH
MKLYNLKRTFLVSTFSLVAVLGISVAASAQGQWGQSKNKRVVTEKKVVITRHPPQQPQRPQQQWGNQQNNRYRVYRNGQYYNTDNRGAELLRQAVRNGYEQGFRAGQTDRSSRRSSRWNSNSMYRSGNYGYQNYVDSSQYQYYFRQGFEKGYADGYNSRQQYGSRSNNGTISILGNILSGILNIQQY